MPWSNQSGGGGWQGGGNGGNRGPWGQRGQGGGGGQNPPDLEEILKRSQDKLRGIMPGGSIGGLGFAIVALVVVGLWLASGFYRVLPDEQGVVLRFGEFTETTQPGLNYHYPYPIETALTPKVTRVNRIDVGLRTSESGSRRTSAVADVPEESLMLTGDENIVDVDFSVFWVINDAGNFLFNIQNPAGTVKAVAESSMREIIGRSDIQPILTQARQKTETAVQELMQKALDEYGSGIQVTQVQLQKVDPPAQVIDSFRDVQAAKADQERLQNEAQAYANKVIPEARGDAARVLQAAEAFKQQQIAESQGQAARFLSVYNQYKLAPEVTRERLFLETMERVFKGKNKVIIDKNAGGSQGVVPYLPLNELTKRDRTGG